MYKFYLGKTLLPVTPQKLQIKIKNANKTYTLINDGEINILKTPGLTEIEFDALLPNQKYPFAVYKKGYHDASYYLEKLRDYKQNKKSFQFIVNRVVGSRRFFDTNMTVAIEDYTIKEDAGSYGTDVMVTIKLKQYKEYGTKTCVVKTNSKKKITKVKTTTRTTGKVTDSDTTYTVKKGDTLWAIAKSYYNDGSKWSVIYNANKTKITNPNLIYPGQVFTIPAL